MSTAALLAALLSAQSDAPGDNLIPFYRCQAVRQTQGGEVRLESNLYPDGRYGGGRGRSWPVIAAGRPEFQLHWNFLATEQRPYAAYVSVTVPLSRKAPRRQVMRLKRVGSDRLQLALSGPATTSGGKRPQALAFVDLDTLLDHAGGSAHLTWEVGPAFDEARESGPLDLAPLRAVVAAFAPLLEELKTKQSAYKTQCTYREEPSEPHPVG